MIEAVKVAEQSLPPPNIVIFVCHRFFGVTKIRRRKHASGTSMKENEDKLKDADDRKEENFKDKCQEKNIASE